jgi:hypothetical protein
MTLAFQGGHAGIRAVISGKSVFPALATEFQRPPIPGRAGRSRYSSKMIGTL